MNRASQPQYLKGHLSFLLIIFLIISGCAALPRTVDITRPEQQMVITNFLDMLAQHQKCKDHLDVSATLSLNSLWRSGTVAGYLQAMAPAHLKLTVLSPLGQPMIIMTTDGLSFQYVDVMAATSFEGSVQGEKFEKHLPAGFNLKKSFYWLTGRLTFDLKNSKEILKVSRDEKNQGYWFELARGSAQFKSIVLFDPHQQLLRRHILLDDQGNMVMDMEYAEHHPLPMAGNRLCLLPGRVTLLSGRQNHKITLLMNDWLPEALFTKNDFTVKVPTEFSKVVVE